MTSESGEKRRIVEAALKGGGVYAEEGEAAAFFLEKGYGERGGDGLIKYSPVEALYLVETGSMRVREGGLELSFHQLLRKLSSHIPQLWRDYVVYRDLRKRRYVVKDGFGPELRFRVFERGKYGEKAARYLVAPIQEGSNVNVGKVMEWLETCRKMRKELILAVIDRRNEVIYYHASIVDLWNV